MNFKIATLPGDGIGPEIVDQAIKVMKAVGEKYGHSFDFEFAPTGASAIDLVGEPYPDSTHEICMNACLLYTSPSPRDRQKSRMPSSA